MAEEGAVVATYPDRTLAEFVAERLRADGVRCWIEADDGGGAYPSLLGMSDSVRVCVRALDAGRARFHLAQYTGDQTEAGETDLES